MAPILVYDNADKDKINILKENAFKSGVYRWIHKDSGKCYIGSSTDLGRRFRSYYNINFLMKDKRIITRALLKYGYSGFSLEILEYCDFSECLEREQYYIDLFNPEYNILKMAGNLLGYKHSLEAIEKMKGRKRAEDAGSPSIPIEVFDLETKTTTTYPSMNETGRALGAASGSIRMYFSRNSQNPFKGRYVLTKTDTTENS